MLKYSICSDEDNSPSLFTLLNSFHRFVHYLAPKLRFVQTEIPDTNKVIVRRRD